MKLFFSAMLLATFLFGADQKLGQPLTAKEPIALASLFARPGRFVGKTAQVKGKVTEVCQMMGCWMSLTDDEGHLLRIQMQEGVIVIPRDSVGKTALAEGKREKNKKNNMTRDQLIAAGKEKAEESGRKFDPTSVKSGKTVYQLAGSGAVIFEK